jgi:L-asparaginase
MTPPRSSTRKRVLVVHTGGTLGMAQPTRTRLDLAPGEHLDRMLTHVPELKEIAEIELISPWNLDSSDIGPSHWQSLARIIADRAGLGQPRGQEGCFDGVVLIHGTDTMAYTASALAFMLRGLDRPVVLTGSQRPLEAWRSDARANLTAAVECATLDVPEVLIVFGDSVLRGCRSTKADSNDYQAFEMPSDAPLGRIGVDLEIDWARVRAPTEAFSLQLDLDPSVVALTIFPGLDPESMARVLGPDVHGRMRALVVRGFGVGNVPMQGRMNLLPLLHSLTSAGVQVVVSSQCHRGRTDLGLYPAGRALLEAGAVEAHDMTLEATVTKAMWALARPERTLGEWFAVDVAGEVSLGTGGGRPSASD